MVVSLSFNNNDVLVDIPEYIYLLYKSDNLLSKILLENENIEDYNEIDNESEEINTYVFDYFLRLGNEIFNKNGNLDLMPEFGYESKYPITCSFLEL